MKWKWDIFIDLLDLKKVTDFYDQVYANKLDNKDEMEKFFGKHSLPKLAEEVTENFNILNTKKLN